MSKKKQKSFQAMIALKNKWKALVLCTGEEFWGVIFVLNFILSGPFIVLTQHKASVLINSRVVIYSEYCFSHDSKLILTCV